MTDLLNEHCQGCDRPVIDCFAAGLSVHNIVDDRVSFRHEQAPRGIWCSECYRQNRFGKTRAVGSYGDNHDE